MHPHHDESEQLQIRCPACGQRFRVGQELRGRTVECGSCEHHFQIGDDTIVRTKKFYPGERRDSRLDGFSRVPHAPAVSPNVQSVHYADEPAQASFEPPKPQRILAAAVGGIGMAMTALLLIVGSNHGGLLDGYEKNARLAIAGFAALVGGIMIIYGNPRGRKKAYTIAILSAAILISLPFFFTQGSEPLKSQSYVKEDSKEHTNQEDTPLNELAQKIGLDPLVQENARLAAGGAKRQAIGIWFRQLRVRNKLLVRDYMLRETEANSDYSAMYPREQETWLMVLSGSDKTIEEIASITSKLGHDADSAKILPKLGLIEVVVDNEVFVEGDLEKLQNTKDPAFYDLNRRELESIDMERVDKAVKRLAEVEPKIYREDLTRRMVQLLKVASSDQVADLGRALQNWAVPGDTRATEAMMLAINRLRAKQMTPPREAVSFLVSRKVEAVAPILVEIWSKDLATWEKLMMDLGNSVQAPLLERMKDSTLAQKQSAARILEKIGDKKALPILRELQAENRDAELRVLIDRATTAIQSRGN